MNKIRDQRHDFFKLATNEWSDKTFLLKSKLCPLVAVCPCPEAIYMYKIMKNCIKSDFKESVFKLETNHWGDKLFLLTSEFRPQGVVSRCPETIYVYKNHGKKCIKSDFKEIFFKLVANDRSEKRFLWTSKFCPWGCLPLTCSYIHLLNHEKMYV